MTQSFENIIIRGIAASVPSNIEENALAAGILGERRCKKQIKLTGIERRHVSGGRQTVSDLCYPIAKEFMTHLEWEPESINVLVLITQCPNYKVPSTAFLLHKLLGLSMDCVVFDVNLGCSAFNAGIEIVASMLQRFPGQARGICLQGDLAYPCFEGETEPDVLASQILFGSAGSGVAIEKTAQKTDTLLHLVTKSDGVRYRAIFKPDSPQIPLEMNGETVFAFSITDVAEEIKAFRSEYGIVEEDIDYYVFHQAQKLILDTLVDSCGIDPDKELRSLRDYGNTSGASIPLSLCANKKIFDEKQTVRILSSGFGVGLTWSTSYLQVAVDDILPIIITDELYER